MRTLWSSLVILVVLAGTALAQPGQTAPIEPYPPPPVSPYPPPPPQPYPQPVQTVPAPYQYQPQPIQLTSDEQALLEQGEISDSAHLGGGVASFLVGFGVGQIVQGRWSETGWIFTLGETASIVAVFVGAAKAFDNCFDRDTSCHNNDGETYLIAGVAGLLVFRAWEIVDAFTGPSKHNRRVRELKMRLGIPQPMYSKQLTPYLNKTRDGGGTAGLTFRF